MKVLEKLRRSYESQGAFVADTNEQMGNFIAEKSQALLSFGEAIDEVKQSIFALGAGSGDVPAAVDFIAEAMNKVQQPLIDFSSLQQRSTDEIVENLNTVIDAYKNFAIPDPHAGKSTKAFKAAVQENLAHKDLSGRWQTKDDETIGRNVLQKLEQQKSMLSQAQRLAQEYHEALNGNESQLGKPIINFLDSIQERLQANAEAADRLRQKLHIDDNAIAVGMSQHIGEQIREVKGRENPFDYASDGWFETERSNLQQLIKLSEQYTAILTKLNSTGFLQDNEISNVERLKKDLVALGEEQARIQSERTVVPIAVNDTEVANLSRKIEDNVEPVTVQIKGEFDSNTLYEDVQATADTSIGADQTPVSISGELQIDNEQVREAFETLNNAIKENKSISQEILTLTTDNFQQKHNAIVAVQEALEKLIGLYHEFQETSSNGIGLSEADFATLAGLLVLCKG